MARKGLGAIKDVEDARDIHLMDIMRETTLPDIVDYEKHMSPVRDQQQRGSCVAFATLGVKEYQEKQQHKRTIDLSEEWVYDQIMQAGGGAQSRDGFKLLQNVGVCLESEMPYNGTLSDDQKVPFNPSKTAQRIAPRYKSGAYARLANLQAMLQSLAQNGPCIMGINWFNDWFEPTQRTSDGYPMLTLRNGDSNEGGHELCIAGYNNKLSALKCKQSWGKSWGKNGYFYMSYDTVERVIMDSWSSVDLSAAHIDTEKAEHLIKKAKEA